MIGIIIIYLLGFTLTAAGITYAEMKLQGTYDLDAIWIVIMSTIWPVDMLFIVAYYGIRFWLDYMKYR